MEKKELIKTLEEELNIPFIDCESSNILTFGYNPQDKELWIVFKGEKIYQYKGITKAQYNDLLKAESKGKWVNANIVKPKIPGTIYGLEEVSI